MRRPGKGQGVTLELNREARKLIVTMGISMPMVFRFLWFRNITVGPIAMEMTPEEADKLGHALLEGAQRLRLMREEL